LENHRIDRAWCRAGDRLGPVAVDPGSGQNRPAADLASSLALARRRVDLKCHPPAEIAMIGYVVLGTNDLPRAMAFYDALLGEIGVGRLMEFGGRGYGWAASMDKPMLCIMKPFDGRPATVGNGVMVGIAAASRDEVNRLHAKALALGGVDEGAVGPRAEYGDGFYAGYFRDLDGNKLDVFCYE
jgi:catechol 2,3-dioxygenase-like lactoylglutathione lyase family enzyme